MLRRIKEFFNFPVTYCRLPSSHTNFPIMKYYALIACAMFVSAAGHTQKLINDANAVKRNVTSFHAIEIGSGIDLYLNQGSDEAVAVSASKPEYRDKIITEVKNGVLKIYYDHDYLHWGGGDRKMKAYVSFTTLDDLHAGGGSDVYTDGSIKSNNLSVGLSGGSDFHGSINATDLTMSASGGSDIYVTGTTKSLNVDASGGSDFHGYDLVADNCDVDASGGSDIEITANKEMNIGASGGSDVHYKGSGVIKNLDRSGSSDIKRVN
jgi:hypothetical protein